MLQIELATIIQTIYQCGGLLVIRTSKFGELVRNQPTVHKITIQICSSKWSSIMALTYNANNQKFNLTIVSCNGEYN